MTRDQEIKNLLGRGIEIAADDLLKTRAALLEEIEGYERGTPEWCEVAGQVDAANREIEGRDYFG